MNSRIAIASLLVMWLGGWASAASAPECSELTEAAAELRASRDRDPAAGVERGRTLLADHSSSDCPEGRMMVYAAVASNLGVLGRHEAAIEAVESALALLENADDPATRAAVRRTAGVVFWQNGAHDRALEHYLAALEASRLVGDVDGAARTAGNIGNLHNSMGNWEEARTFHRQALEGFEAVGWPEGIAGTLVNLGALSVRLAEAHERAGDMAEARAEYANNLDYNRRALSLFESLDNPRGIAYAADNIARALIHLGRVEEALGPYERSLELRREIGDTSGVINSLLTGSDALLALDRADQALELLDEAESLMTQDDRALLAEIVAERVAAYERRGDFEAALGAQQRLMSLNDAQAAEDLATRVQQLQQQFGAEQLEQELALERARAEVSEQQVRRQQLIIAASLVSVLLLLVVIGLLYSRYRLGRRLSRTLDKASRTDSLTGLSNRRDMIEQIERAVIRRNEANDVASLIMADIDSFKRINDTLGHQVGDEVLCHVAELIRLNVRGIDVAARWGGEEFLILLPGTPEHGARSVSENLRRRLEESPPQVGGRSLSLTLTLGVTEIEPGVDLNELIRRADEAMYAGKSRGKNQVVSAAELAT